MWFIILGLGFILMLLSLFYVASRINKLVSKKFVSAFVTVASAFAAYFLCGLVNAAMIFLHLAVFSLICEGVFTFVKKKKRGLPFVCALALTCVYLGFGAFSAFSVTRTEYTLKGSENFKIVGFSDSHIGTTFDSLEGHIEKINAENPDIVVIVGDFVDDSTDFAQMQSACQELSHLKSRYGTYFVFGNHDAGYGDRGYGKDELISCLAGNDVTVLQDEAVKLGKITLLGRRDKGDRLRKSMDEYELPEGAYTVILDHQPCDYANEKGKAQLVISGHTHGGQFFPLNKIGEWMGVNDATYGHHNVNNTDFIVSSGISDWELWFKTGCFSEYFVINIVKSA